MAAMTRFKNTRNLRVQIAQGAARMLANQECIDIQSARHKASARLHCSDKRQMPDNWEIEEALHQYQQLFQQNSQPGELVRLRQLAVEAMRSLAGFTPRLTGRVLTGTAGTETPIRLYLYAETPDAVALHLLERHIPFEQREVRLPYPKGVVRSRPLILFHAGDAALELVVLSPCEHANPPLDPQSNRPHTSAALSQVEALVRGNSQ